MKHERYVSQYQSSVAEWHSEDDNSYIGEVSEYDVVVPAEEYHRLRKAINLLIGDGRVDVLTDNNYGDYMCFFCQGEGVHEKSGVVIRHDKDCPVLAAQAALQGGNNET